MIERPATIEEGFSQEAPLVYNFGYKSPGTNRALFNMLVTKLAERVAERMEANKKSNKCCYKTYNSCNINVIF